MSRRTKDGVGQLRLDWASTAAAPAAVGSMPAVEPPPAASPRRPEAEPLVLTLPWDFIDSFPAPRPEAIDAGVLAEGDGEPENLQSLHEELIRQLLAMLREGDTLADARRRGVDPKTGVKPKTKAAAERLRQYFALEPGRLQRAWDAALGMHKDGFGTEAAGALAKAVRARHAGVAVVAEGKPVPDDSGSFRTPVVDLADDAFLPESADSTTTPSDTLIAAPAGPDAAGVIARMPVPRPLRHAVAAGIFGVDEDGRPISPSPDEVHEITARHGELLAELIGELLEADRRESPAAQTRRDALDAAVAKYAEDFGQRAADRLLDRVRRQSPHDEAKARGR